MKLIRELRQNKKLSLRALAQQTDLSPSFLYEIEKGTRNPSKSTLVKLSKVLGSKEELFLEADLVEPEIEEIISDRKVYNFLKRISQLKSKERNIFLNRAEALI